MTHPKFYKTCSNNQHRHEDKRFVDEEIQKPRTNGRRGSVDTKVNGRVSRAPSGIRRSTSAHTITTHDAGDKNIQLNLDI